MELSMCEQREVSETMFKRGVVIGFILGMVVNYFLFIH